MEKQREVEVQLEELGQHSWLGALFNTLTGSYGSAQFRFAARPTTDQGASRDVVLGATFPMMRFQDLDDHTMPNAWLELAEERLAELDRDLVQRGWRRADRSGTHWWSRIYELTPQTSGEQS